jgi:hypothetical protein
MGDIPSLWLSSLPPHTHEVGLSTWVSLGLLQLVGSRFFLNSFHGLLVKGLMAAGVRMTIDKLQALVRHLSVLATHRSGRQTML